MLPSPTTYCSHGDYLCSLLGTQLPWFIQPCCVKQLAGPQVMQLHQAGLHVCGKCMAHANISNTPGCSLSPLSTTTTRQFTHQQQLLVPQHHKKPASAASMTMFELQGRHQVCLPCPAAPMLGYPSSCATTLRGRSANLPTNLPAKTLCHHRPHRQHNMNLFGC